MGGTHVKKGRQKIKKKRMKGRERSYRRKNFENVSKNMECTIKYDTGHKLQDPTGFESRLHHLLAVTFLNLRLPIFKIGIIIVSSSSGLFLRIKEMNPCQLQST